jgi:homocysteine S-methyltransferase
MAFSAFREQARILARSGVDLLILETFSNTDEILAAIEASLEVTDVPVIAQMTATEHQETIYGERIEQAIERFASMDGVVAVGLNCSTGPSAMLESLERIRAVTDKPVSVQPNAGLPRRVEDRTLYMSTPEYMAEYAKRFFEKGARIIGGCCGTGPEHIKAIVQVIRSLDKADVSHRITTSLDRDAFTSDRQKCGAISLVDKSRLGSKLANGQMVTTVEITPPRGVDLHSTIEKAKLCAEMGVDAVNIPDGPRASSRMSPLVTAIEIQRQAGIETVLHFCCRDRNLIGMQSDLLGASAIGLRNMLIITGDPPKLGDYPDATAVFDMDSIALTAVLRELNKGRDIGGNDFSPGVCLTIGVGANPVAADMSREIERFQRKVDAGAEYAITQPIFDPDSFFRFMEAIRSSPIPVIAGIWPFTSYKNAEFMANEVPGVSVPPALLQRMSGAKTKEQGRQWGIEIAREMIEDIKDYVAGFTVSAPFGNVRTALAVLGKIDVDDL